MPTVHTKTQKHKHTQTVVTGDTGMKFDEKRNTTINKSHTHKNNEVNVIKIEKE